MIDRDHATPGARAATHGSIFSGVPDAAVDFDAGHVIADQFEVIRQLGRGGMGIVYEVQDRLTQQRLALKVLLPSILAKPRAYEAFLREVNIARKLRHPGIVAVYDVRQVGPLMFFTMEYLRGNTLREILTTHKRLSFGKAIGVVHRICRALDHAHQFTVHRDICPENIMVLPDASVYLLDFGIAMALDAGDSEHEVPAGRAFYMAPEQMENPGAVDPRADLFSLGVVFFEMLTGELPTGYTRISDLRPDLPAECDKVLRHALGPLAKRYRRAGDFAKALEQCLRPRPAAVAETVVMTQTPVALAAPAAAPPLEPPPLPTVVLPVANAPVKETPPTARARSPLVHSSQEREWEEWEKRVAAGRKPR